MRTFAITFFALFFSVIVQLQLKAEVRLPAIVSSNMVLQRNATVNLWGWAEAHEKISIETSWLKQKLNVEANYNGVWKVQVITTNSKDAQTIQIKSKTSKITLENVLFGEVWLCSGQSNMEQAMSGHTGQPTFGALLATMQSNNSQLRLFTVKKAASKNPKDDLEQYVAWQPATPSSVVNFSAVGYFFGQQLQEVLDVPVGIIHASWGGSIVEAWMSNDMLSSYQPINLDGVDLKSRTNHIPTALFNSMIHPIVPYVIKGALWYQGESNRLDPDNYLKFFPSMVQDWRNHWGIGEFPFFYVQIAPFLYGNNEVFESAENSAFIREAQLKSLDLILNSGIAVTMDLGDANNIHPPKKKEVADRLLFNALHQTYGFNAIDCAGPVYDSHEIHDGGILLNFKHAETGLFAYDGLSGFEIAGDDKVFYPAVATMIDRKKVLVKSESVPLPVAVRYAWSNWIVGSLYDTNLLPASSFRTDHWNEARRAAKP
ncbi:MAG: sialate O-acetylesterase [Bacteroidales bacterium]|nr:sialate O-acetylesterase [Bacteroidales bacterium]